MHLLLSLIFLNEVIMKTIHLILLLILSTPFACASNKKHAIETAVMDVNRLPSHKARDENRKPRQVLALSGVQFGDKVADLGAFGGYYTALLSRVVGDKGLVYSIDAGLAIKKLPQFKLDRLTPAYLKQEQPDNVNFSVAERLDKFVFEKPLDMALMALYYHDAIWTGEDRQAMNQRIYNALKPGGRYVIIDHEALPNSAESYSQQHHRVNASRVKDEILSVGFELEGDYDFLRNPRDRKDKRITDPDIRGRTDRFVLVFVKPIKE